MSGKCDYKISNSVIYLFKLEGWEWEYEVVCTKNSSENYHKNFSPCMNQKYKPVQDSRKTFSENTSELLLTKIFVLQTTNWHKFNKYSYHPRVPLISIFASICLTVKCTSCKDEQILDELSTVHLIYLSRLFNYPAVSLRLAASEQRIERGKGKRRRENNTK